MPETAGAGGRIGGGGAPAPRRRGAWRGPALWAVVFAVYLSNGRYNGTEDTEPAALLSYSASRGDGVSLDRFRPRLQDPNGNVSLSVYGVGGHLVSIQPVASALLAVPVEVPMFLALDRLSPGWDADPGRFDRYLRLCSKVAASAMVAAAVALLAATLRRWASPTATATAVAAAAFGSGYWPTASQAMWQHGPAALLLTATLWLLTPAAGRLRLALAGLSTAGMVACRQLDVVFAAAVLAWMIRERPRSLGWFLPGPIAVGSALLAYNLSLFGTVEGGQAIAESRHPLLHGVAGPWAGSLPGGAAGTLFSPSRGLVVFSPWVALAMLGIPAAWRRLEPGSVVRWLIAALVPSGLVLSKYAVWWGGHCFGPRYWIDAVPILAIPLAFAVDGVRARPLLRALAAAAIAWSAFVHGVGAYLYPSGWNFDPDNVDLHHARLWDWSDTEVSRCLGLDPRRRAR